MCCVTGCVFPFFMSKESRNQDTTVNRKVGHIVKALCLLTEKLFIFWPCFKTENENVKICATELPSVYTVSRESCKVDFRQRPEVHFHFLSRGNRKEFGLRLKRNAAYRLVIILIFWGEFLNWVGQPKDPVFGFCFILPLCWLGRIKKRCC